MSEAPHIDDRDKIILHPADAAIVLAEHPELEPWIVVLRPEPRRP